jgi:hypothetical protein
MALRARSRSGDTGAGHEAARAKTEARLANHKRDRGARSPITGCVELAVTAAAAPISSRPAAHRPWSGAAAPVSATGGRKQLDATRCDEHRLQERI